MGRDTRPIPCAAHRPVRHRGDIRPPWCDRCGLDADGYRRGTARGTCAACRHRLHPNAICWEHADPEGMCGCTHADTDPPPNRTET
jgi:hypothetical protein